VFANNAHDNTQGDLQLLGQLENPERTYYVDAAIGSDAHTEDQAQSPAAPWRTIKRALAAARAGDVVLVMPGTYAESVESKVDGTQAKPIAIRAVHPGRAVVDPPAGAPGFFVSHDYVTIDGFVVRGSSVNGIQAGPHDGGGPVRGVVVTNAVVHDNALAGLKFTNATRGIVRHSVVNNNGSHGIVYSGANGNIVNNLVYSNFGAGGEYGLTVEACAGCANTGHLIRNNTVYGNARGGIRLGTSGAAGSEVAARAINNIVAANPIGIKEPNGCCAGQVVNYNNVFGNTTSDYDLSMTAVGGQSLAAAPGFVSTEVAHPGFLRLGRVATGQAQNSPCIDRGSNTAEALGLGGRTAFSDKAPDTGAVDLGYHGVLLMPTEGAVSVSSAGMTFNTGGGNDSFTLSARLSPGAGSDGIEIGTEYTVINFGSFEYTLPASGFQDQGSGVWHYTGTGQLTSGTFQALPDGSVTLSVQASGLNLAYSDSPITIQVRVGDDFASSTMALRGTLAFP
jgi:hypothetical protein